MNENKNAYTKYKNPLKNNTTFQFDCFKDQINDELELLKADKKIIEVVNKYHERLLETMLIIIDASSKNENNPK